MEVNLSILKLMVSPAIKSEDYDLTDLLPVGLAMANGEEVAVKVVEGGCAMDYEAQFTGETRLIQKLLSPVSQQEAGTVRCIGLNYKEHAAEMKLALPNTPT